MTLIKTVLRYAAMSVLFIGLTACGDQEETQAATADIEVSISANPHWGTLVFDLQAITDSTVDNVKAVEVTSSAGTFVYTF
ncbi:hypothetical protein DLR73_12135 [Vibrio paracholerae]|uniref:hypothetical protein n=1 Tax=Vibrio paracholerae TaxID=650003 RepID=UPI000DE41486|nr:hypothetical protein [Vibrio paracholerae]RBM86591.1 hypothetical protein DLR73_12135 [Vibrio paracholerae]